MGIWKRLLFVTAFLMVTVFCIDSYIAYKDARANAIESLQLQAERTRAVLMATRRVYHHQFLDSGIPLTDKTLGFLPAHSLSKISKDFKNWDQSGLSFNNVSDRPRNPDNKADADEMKAIEYFRKNSSEKLYFHSFKSEKGEPFYLYANPIWMEAYCLKCHGKKEDAPSAIRNSYTTAYDYKVGDLRGILSIKLPSSVLETKAMKNFKLELIAHLALFIGMFFAFFYTIRKYVRQPLNLIGTGMEEIAAGNYESRLSGFKGELANLQQSFNLMAERISKHRVAINNAKDEAERANKAKSEFLASMSHELRTPLNAVLGFAQMLQFDPNNPLSSAQNAKVENILEGGDHLLQLVNQVLDLAKIEVDQISFSLEEVNASEVVADCVKLISPLGKPKGITITSKLDDKLLPPLRTDLTRLKQILINLISNAVKFNKQGGTVTVEARETDDGFLHISIKDTGHGIAEEDFSSVFELFNQLNQDPMIAKEGTGIGLPVTKMLVERMSGRVGFDSEKGIGSTFWIELPLASNKQVLIWADYLRIGVDAIDLDHKMLISLMNKISNSSIADNELNDVFGKLIDYTLYHFKREEVVMEVCGYPDLEEHRRLHKDLTAQVAELVNKLRKGQDPEIIPQLQKFLRGWLVNHILKEDAKISKYTLGKGEDIKQALDNIRTTENVTSLIEYSINPLGKDQ